MKQERVYVQDKNVRPLMPTVRFGHVRKLMKSGRAKPVCNNPFTIRLKYDTPGIVQELYMGIDPGRENIGIGVSDSHGNCIHMEEIHTCNKSIKHKMDERRMHRQARRRHSRLRKQRKAMRDGTDFKTGNDDMLRSAKICRS